MSFANEPTEGYICSLFKKKILLWCYVMKIIIRISRISRGCICVTTVSCSMDKCIIKLQLMFQITHL